MLSLLPLSPGVPTVVAGDFNLHHSAWSIPPSTNQQSAEDLLEWAANNLFFLANPRGVRTRLGVDGQHDSIIDLVFINRAAMDMSTFSAPIVDENLSYGSDHNALVYTAHLPPPVEEDPPSDLGKRLDPEKQQEWLAEFSARVRDITASYRNPETTQELDRLWTGQAQAPESHAPVVKKAKQEWANAILETATPDNVWRLADWSAGKCRTRIPPLITDAGVAASPAELGETLKTAFFPLAPPQVEISLESDPQAKPIRNFAPISVDEVSDALRGTSNVSAPGPSEISYRLIKWGFPMCSQLLTDVFNACLRLGHHPKAWRATIVAIVPKPGKTDMSQPRSYRPISLLECLSKLLEKVVTRCILFDVGKYQLIPTNQFGCRDNSSTTDAGITLIHDIQSGWKKGLTASALAFDIKGFFDHVHHGRLLEVLRLAGFPFQVRAWIQSFISNRQVSIRVNGFNTDPSISSVGIPQGSPLSPILAALYTSPVIEISIRSGMSTLYFYVDDGLLVAFSKSIAGNVRQLQADFQTINRALQAVGLSVDQGKFEIMHFTRAKSPVLLPIHIHLASDNSLTVFPNPIMRWLGFFLDRKLEFKEHVRIMCNRAMSKVQALNVLGNSVRGMNHANRRLAYKTIVLPVLTYGAPLWYTGICQKGLTNQMTKVQNAGLRLILGTFHTSQVAALHHIGSILPIPLLLAVLWLMQQSASAHYHGMPSLSYAYRSRGTTAQSKADLLQNYAPTDNDARKQLIRNIRKCETDARSDPSVVNVFTDGSRHPVGDELRTGAAFTVFHLGREIAQGLLGLGAHSDNFDGEMYALARASQRLQDVPAPITRRSVVFRENIDWLLSSYHNLSVNVSWSPGHSGIRGNERADTLAKTAAGQRSFIGSTIAWAKADTKAAALEQWVKQWKESAKTSPSALSLTHPPSFKLAKFHCAFTGNRRTYSHTIQASLGHHSSENTSPILSLGYHRHVHAMTHYFKLECMSSLNALSMNMPATSLEKHHRHSPSISYSARKKD
ncbi:reverse transcriptase from mobile element jockey protein [Salix suchowensis]|nr:reverse transcriptase from mobile element jockey protein [Salix suchowensis]